MICNEYKVFELINTAAISSLEITTSGVFIFKDAETAISLKKECEKNNIQYDDASAENELDFEIDNISILKDVNDFSRKISETIRTGELNKYYCYLSEQYNRLVIWDTENINIPYFFSTDKKIFKNDRTLEPCNIYYWEKIYEILSHKLSDERNNDKSFSILSYEKGRCLYEYSGYDLSFNNQDLSKVYNKLILTLDKLRDYQMIIKNRCVENIEKKNHSSLKVLISELDLICDKSILDFEIFISNIDFDSHIQKYHEHINLITADVRNIIEKMLSNIFTLPITYAGAIFTFDKLEDKSFRIFIFIALLFYTILSCGFLVYEIFETKNIRKNLFNEIQYFTNGSIYLENSTKEDTKELTKKINGIVIISILLILMFIVLLVFFGLKIFEK